MNRPLRLAKVAGVCLALVPWVQGCDSLLGEPRPSADGGGCGVIYVYVDGGLAATPVEGTSEVGAEGGQPPAVDVGEGSAPAVDALAGLDQGTLANPRDADSLGVDGTLAPGHDSSMDVPQDARPIDANPRSDAPAPDGLRDLPPADTRDARLDAVILHLDTSMDTTGLDSSDAGAEAPVLVILDGAADGSDARTDVADVRDAGPEQGGDVAGDTPAIDTRDSGPDLAQGDVVPDAPDAPPLSVDAYVPGLVKQVSAGQYHTCALRNDGTAFCWGSNASGQSAPPSATLFSQIDSGDSFNCGVTLDHTVVCWGNNNQGQGTVPAGQFAQVATGSLHTCGIKLNGTIICWGYNSNGQCNAPGGTFIQVAAGSLHTCGIQTGGTTVCWGNNSHGETAAPSGVFSQVSARRFHTCAIQGGGVVSCWGSNSYGESTAPVGSFTRVAAGNWHACGILNDGTFACWGSNSVGQSTPPSGRFLRLGAGSNHTCGVRNDGAIVCWGDNGAGQSTPP